MEKYLKGFQRYEALLNDMGIVLLIAVAAVAMIYESGDFSGWARCIGVFCTGVLAYLRVNILWGLLVGMIVTVVLRWISVA
ncbi:MAG: AzlD domain-containing protein [Gammaproteobacteria bacterium]|uniref:AzlD domain-containing protein n=1 Tax=Marinomonas sp. ef1 TaxID=2005043 RepID=UPI000C2832FB|nr:AzlD domain-containing protein [Marinomonas sp. ef1]MBU2237258.1 AzlD domain-containing protein [Gammaproteobacteria bacterium]